MLTLLEAGPNSRLLQHLSSRSLQYRYLLYVFDGLRTLSPAIKHKFVKCWEALNAAKVDHLALSFGLLFLKNTNFEHSFPKRQRVPPRPANVADAAGNPDESGSLTIGTLQSEIE